MKLLTGTLSRQQSREGGKSSFASLSLGQDDSDAEEKKEEAAADMSDAASTNSETEQETA